ncbi:unnamed protein product [Caenorhabditis angaria]|uniref:Uncharacterized protein n=1 Tax=Caenorhabditis angaria TaxID=860376 RepID=A0A9P1IKT3_9PELO|nr:unnamed protein product [Caenorhabditis angaria]
MSNVDDICNSILKIFAESQGDLAQNAENVAEIRKKINDQLWRQRKEDGIFVLVIFCGYEILKSVSGALIALFVAIVFLIGREV